MSSSPLGPSGQARRLSRKLSEPSGIAKELQKSPKRETPVGLSLGTHVASTKKSSVQRLRQQLRTSKVKSPPRRRRRLHYSRPNCWLFLKAATPSPSAISSSNSSGAGVL